MNFEMYKIYQVSRCGRVEERPIRRDESDNADG